MALEEKLAAIREMAKSHHYASFGIDLAKGNGDGTRRLPIPARFVIDRGGIIRAADADPDYTRRPEPEQTVEVLRRLGR